MLRDVMAVVAVVGLLGFVALFAVALFRGSERMRREIDHEDRMR
jgi:hypothetical protein